MVTWLETDIRVEGEQVWIKRLPELCQDYEPRNILNLDEFGLFFKVLPEKGLAEKVKKSKDGKKSKQGMSVMFIVASDGFCF